MKMMMMDSVNQSKLFMKMMMMDSHKIKMMMMDSVRISMMMECFKKVSHWGLTI